VDRGLRQRCEAKLQELELPVPFTIEAFCEVVGAHLGRQVVLCPVDTRTGPCGLWVATPEAHLFFYERDTTPLHKALILGHEAGHALFEDDAADVLDAEELAGLLGLNPLMVRRVLGRTSYDDEGEQRAEVFGRLVAKRAARDAPPSPRPATQELAIVGRLESALEARRKPR
jgi:hypothetical protein